VAGHFRYLVTVDQFQALLKGTAEGLKGAIAIHNKETSRKYFEETLFRITSFFLSILSLFCFWN
jgi:hypothetical protein